MSISTIQRRLRDRDLYARRPAKVPKLSRKNVAARLKFARDHENWTVDDWKKVLWSDETKINMFCNDSPGHVRRPAGERLNPRYTVGTVKFGGGNIMIWGCFSWQGVGPLYHINGKMDRFQYRDILKNQMLPHARRIMPRGWSFQHDNDPKHTAKMVKDWLGANRVRVLSWPAQSPDLNPIENLWGQVKVALGRQKFQTPAELFNAVQHIWDSINQQNIENLINSMPRRCAEVIKAKGFSIDY